MTEEMAEVLTEKIDRKNGRQCYGIIIRDKLRKNRWKSDRKNTEEMAQDINGKVHPPQKKQGLFYETYARSRVQYPVKVPQEAFFVLGDRRSEAKDSRDFGPVKEKEIKGKVVIVIRKKNI